LVVDSKEWPVYWCFVGVTGFETQKLFDAEARVHAGEDRQFFGWGHGQAALVEFGGVLLIGCQGFVGDAHLGDPFLFVLLIGLQFSRMCLNL
jgi:hypothetical protein